MAKPWNWYYADYDGGHTTRQEQFANDEAAMRFYLNMPTCRNGLETVYNCGPYLQSETIIWEAETDHAEPIPRL